MTLGGKEQEILLLGKKLEPGGKEGQVGGLLEQVGHLDTKSET